MSNFFKVMTIVLIVAFFDQFYMLNQYGNISRETAFLTLCLLLMSVYYVFFSKEKKAIS